MKRPVCRCHGEPMVKNGRDSWHGGQAWSCAERRRRQNREYHDALSGWAWSKRALQMRRANALHRIRNRAKEKSS